LNESYNPHVLGFVKKYAGLTTQQIRAHPKWQPAAARKPKHFDEMSEADKGAFKKMLDAKFPPNPIVVFKPV
jgi:hypothetical protein